MGYMQENRNILFLSWTTVWFLLAISIVLRLLEALVRSRLYWTLLLLRSRLLPPPPNTAIFPTSSTSSVDPETSPTRGKPQSLNLVRRRLRMFGVVFPNRSFPIDISTFAQIDTFHWVLDMNHFVGEAYDKIGEMCIFLLNGLTLPPDKALAVYVQSPGSPFVYCGAVTVSRPSAVLPLPWPEPGSDAAVAAGQPLQLTSPDAAPLSAKIGVSVEDVGALPSLDVAAERRIERMALRVGENLFNFMQSFCGVDGSKLVVPTDILDRWFNKFQERAKRDPEYLKGFAL